MNNEEINYLLRQNKINAEYDLWLNKLKQILENSRLSIPHYRKEEVVERLLQMISYETFPQFNRDFDKISSSAAYGLGQIHIDLKKKTIQVPIKYLIKNIILFFMYVTKYFFSSFFKWLLSNQSKTNQLPINIFNSYGFYSIFAKEIKFERNFITHGPLAFLNSPNLLFIQADHFERVNNVVFSKSPFTDLYRFLPINFKNFKLILSSFINLIINYFASLLNSSLSVLFNRDLVIQAAIEPFLKNKMLSHIIFTNSNATEQLLPFRHWRLKNFETHIAFYSVNSKAMKYSFIEDKLFAEYPYFNHLCVDHAWVWDVDQAEFLKQFIPTLKTHIVGPIVFYLDRTQPKIRTKEKVITIFDITPFAPDHLKMKIGWGGYNYFCYENIYAFMNDIMAEVKKFRQAGESITVRLKPKRSYTPIHHQEYISMLKRFESAGELKILGPESDLFEVIQESDLILSIPFSSPPIIASHLKKKALLYDPTGVVVNNYKLSPGVEYSSGKVDLSKKLKMIIDNLSV